MLSKFLIKTLIKTIKYDINVNCKNLHTSFLIISALIFTIFNCQDLYVGTYLHQKRYEKIQNVLPEICICKNIKLKYFRFHLKLKELLCKNRCIFLLLLYNIILYD